MLFGQGDDNFTVQDIVEGMISVLHGDGGSDSLFVTGGGGNSSPLIVLGDMCQDGSLYGNSGAEYDEYAASALVERHRVQRSSAGRQT